MSAKLMRIVKRISWEMLHAREWEVSFRVLILFDFFFNLMDSWTYWCVWGHSIEIKIFHQINESYSVAQSLPSCRFILKTCSEKKHRLLTGQYSLVATLTLRNKMFIWKLKIKIEPYNVTFEKCVMWSWLIKWKQFNWISVTFRHFNEFKSFYMHTHLVAPC